jgi:rod shape-determining protein MreB and related proteins
MMGIGWFEKRGKIRQIGIDTGTQQTKAVLNSMVLMEMDGHLHGEINPSPNRIMLTPSWIARRGVDAVIGQQAKELISKGTEWDVTQIVRDGRIAEHEKYVEFMAMYFRDKLRLGEDPKKIDTTLEGSQLIFAIPPETDEGQRWGTREMIKQKIATKSDIYLVDQTTLAAAGQNINLEDCKASMIIDLGGGTCSIGINAYFTTMWKRSINAAGDRLNEAIQKGMKDEHRLEISILEAERAKIMAGVAIPTDLLRKKNLDIPPNYTMRCRREGVLKEGEVPFVYRECSPDELLYWMTPVLKDMDEGLGEVLRKVSPGLIEDLMMSPVILTGGTSQLRGLDIRFSNVTGLVVVNGENPETATVRGLSEFHRQPNLQRILKALNN